MRPAGRTNRSAERLLGPETECVVRRVAGVERGAGETTSFSFRVSIKAHKRRHNQTVN